MPMVATDSSRPAIQTALSESYLLALPKAEVHCHLEGSVPPELAVRLAERNGVALPTLDPKQLYQWDGLEEFLVIYVAVSRAMQSARDFEEVTYTSLVDAAAGGLRYREFSFNPSNHPDLDYPEMMDGVLRGCRAAERDVGVTSRVIIAINRELGGDVALDLVREVIANPFEEVVGIGLDHNELVARPAEFKAAYDLAREAGLGLAAHTGERGDHTEITECLDVLRLDRVDHGYAALLDPELLDRCVQSQIPFGSCWQSDPARARIVQRDEEMAAMIDAGLNISISSDDPGMVGSHIGPYFVDAAATLGWTVEDAERFSLAGLDCSFVDETTRARLRAEFTSELARLRPLAYAAD
jgi:adenosine deaminase